MMPKNKKGQLNLQIAKGVMITFLVLAVLAIAMLLALTSLQDANIFTAGGQENKTATAVVHNLSDGIQEFFSNTTTVFSILIVVVIIGAIGIVIYVVSRFGSGSGGL